MKYFILCPYCNKTYIIDGENQTSFTCPNCGASNMYGDIVSTEDDTEKIRQAAEKIVQEKEERRNKLERLYQREDERKRQKEEELRELRERQEKEDAYLFFQQRKETQGTPSGSPDSDNNSETEQTYETYDENDMPKIFSTLFVIATIFLVVICAVAYISPQKQSSPYNVDYQKIIQEQREKGNNTEEAVKIRALMDNVAALVANGDTAGLRNCLYVNGDYTWISDSDWLAFFEDYYGEAWGDTTFKYTEVSYSSSGMQTSSSLSDEVYYQVFNVTDSNDKKFDYTFYQNSTNVWWLFLDYSDLVAPSCEEGLLEIWNAIKEAALDYTDASAIQKYFTDDITTDELNDLLRYVRFSLGDHEPYARAELTGLEISCSMDDPSHDKFQIEIEAEYLSQSSSHAAGNYSAEIGLQYYNHEWKIYDLPSYDFFTIESVKR